GHGASLLGALPEGRWELGLYARFGGFDGQHDLRGYLQPGDHRSEALPGPGSASGRSGYQLRQGGGQHQPAAWHRLAGQPLPGGTELWQRPAVEALLPIWIGTSRPTGWSAVFRAA